MRPNGQGQDSQSDFLSSHLWVGNLPFHATESDLLDLFAKHGDIDGITCYASRSYAFVYFKRVEDAVAAKQALQGFLLNGNAIKIEFAKPAKPSKNVWVGGFGSSVTKEKLEEALSKFGSIEDLKFIRDRNTALVDFARLEDASAAVKNLNGMQIGDDRVRVDFLRSHPGRREQSDFYEMGNSHFKGGGGFDSSWNCPDTKKPQQSQLFGGSKSGHPSKVLWVGYPPSVVIDEEMLHNAMILHGEIEGIKSFPARHYAFVEFRSVQEARRAKDSLQGRLFNDPRITIMFSNSDFAPVKDFGPRFSGFKVQRPDAFDNEGPFRPPIMDMFPSNRPVGPNSFAGTNGMHGPGMRRPFGPRGNLDPLLPIPDFHDPSATGLLPSPGLLSSSAYKSSGWDVLDRNHFPRELKRSRVDGPATFHGTAHTSVQGGDYVDEPFGSGPQLVGRGHVPGRDNEDYIWRGVIAKGGTPVCHARCIPIGHGLDFQLPEVVNCSARTGLDMLAKHYAGAIGFDIVFFLPDSEDDFANYTEFLRYLGSKNRAGVAKLDDGTTLFLVPPSDFLTDVLKVTGRERLYGVVLKLQPTQLGVAPVSQLEHQSFPPVQQMDPQQGLPTHDYIGLRHDLSIQMEYHNAGAEAAVPPRAAYPTTSLQQAQSSDGISARLAQSLTPELVASLQSMGPTAQSPVAQVQLSSLSTGLPLPVSTVEKGAFTQGWSQQAHALDPTGQLPQQSASQLYPHTAMTNTFQSTSLNLNAYLPPMPVSVENTVTQNPVYNLQEQGSVASRPALPLPFVAQGQQFVPPTQATQPYPFEVPYNTRNSFGMGHGTHATSYSVADSQPNNPGSYAASELHVANSSHPEIFLPSSNGNVISESSGLEHKPLPVPPGGAEGTSEVEVDKNQRYQSTLQFAASLLLQIQQQQQQQSGSKNLQ